jgi:hypothetical protein
MSNPIKVIFQSYREQTPPRYFWDYAFFEDIIDGRMWRPPCWLQFSTTPDSGFVPRPTPADGDGGIIVLAARHHATEDYAEMLNHDMARMPWIILFLLGDEESVFPAHLLHHDRMKIYKMMSRPDDRYVDRRLPNFYAPHVHLLDDMPCPRKSFDWVFAGQVTHDRRRQCVAALRDMSGGMLVESQGFTQGVSPDEYVTAMASAKVAPCPSGPQAPDSFRLAEAMELGCVPIVDATAPIPYPDDYWAKTLGEDFPFHDIHDWRILPRLIDDVLADWPRNANRIGAWWMQYKRRLTYTLLRDIEELSGSPSSPRFMDDQITFVVYASQPFHDDTALDTTIRTIRNRFPLAEVVLMLDGVADTEFVRQTVWKCQRDHRYLNVLPVVLDSSVAQANAIRIAVDRFIRTPLTAILNAGDTLPDVAKWTTVFEPLLNGEISVHVQSFLDLYVGTTERLKQILLDNYGPEGEYQP